MWLTCFTVFAVHKNSFHFLNNVEQTFVDMYKEYNTCLVSFLSFSELFPAFNWAKEIGSLLRIWLGVSIFKPSANWFSLLSSRILSTTSIIFSFYLILNVLSLETLLTVLFTLVSTFLIEYTWCLFISPFASPNMLHILLRLE